MVAAGRKSGSVLYAGALALLASVPGAAEEMAPTLRSGAYAWGMGAGVVANDRGYRGEGIDVVPIPVLYFETQRFRFLGTQAEYELFGDGPGRARRARLRRAPERSAARPAAVRGRQHGEL